MSRSLNLARLSSFCATAVQGQLPAGVERLGWLAACRAAVSGEAGPAEHRMPPKGCTVLGAAR